MRLYAFQKDGVARLRNILSSRGWALLADDMGLGKTIQGLTVMKDMDRLPLLVVCPKIARSVWQEHADLMGLTHQVLSGMSPPPDPPPVKDVTIINYDVLTTWAPVLSRVAFRSFIFDESHMLKNKRSKRATAASRLIEGAILSSEEKPLRLLSTGTPILNRPIELWHQLLVASGERTWGTWWQFAKRYCDLKWDGYGWNADGASNLDELRKRLEPIMVRRTKDEVLKDLPPVTLQVVRVDPDKKELARYEKAKKEFQEWWEEARQGVQDPTVPAYRMHELEALLALAKIPAMKEWAETAPPFMVWTWHREVAERYGQALGVPFIHGEMSVDGRTALVNRFQRGEFRGLVATIASLGVGITLTRAKAAVFVELPWTPGVFRQAVDRMHRIGQVGATLGIVAVSGPGKIDSIKWMVMSKKMTTIGKVVREEGVVAETLKEFTRTF